MTSNLRIVAPLLAGAALLLAACSDNGGADVTVTADPTATPTAVPTATAIPTATPTPSPAAALSPTPEAPNAAPIELDPGVTSLGEDMLLPTLQAGGVLNLDPIDLAGELGITPPPCAALVLYLSWQVRHPYPPTDVDIELYWTSMGGTELIGEGTSGQTSRGCGAIQVVNNSDVVVTVEISYAIGEITG